MFGRILALLDGSPVAEQALPFAVDQIQRSGRMPDLVRIVPPNAGAGTASPVVTTCHSRAVAFEATGVRVVTEVLCAEPAAGITAATRDQPADLEVIATQRAGRAYPELFSGA
jgi:hypothetical protein